MNSLGIVMISKIITHTMAMAFVMRFFKTSKCNSYVLLFLGTTQRHHKTAPNPFIIIGVFYPQKESQTIKLTTDRFYNKKKTASFTLFDSFSHLFLLCQYLFTLRKYRVISYYVAFWSCDAVRKLMRQTTQKVNKH
jgi:hypothetical protein